MDGLETIVTNAPHPQVACMEYARTISQTLVFVILDGLDLSVIVHKHRKAAIWIMLLLPDLGNVCVILDGKVNYALNV